MKPKILILSGYGLNRESDAHFAWQKAGGNPEIVHVNDLIDGQKKLKNYQIFMIPGGFCYADETGSGNAMANKIKYNLGHQIVQFIQDEKLVLGVCNGFQVLVNLGLLPGIDGDYESRKVALQYNASARLQCRWVYLKSLSKKCVFTKNIKDLIYCPVSHGEGNFYTDNKTLKALYQNDQIVFKFVDDKGKPANGKFPINPNGALQDITGICDSTGRVMGMMPHAEDAVNFTNRLDWTKIKLERKAKNSDTAGLQIYQNAVNYFK